MIRMIVSLTTADRDRSGISAPVYNRSFLVFGSIMGPYIKAWTHLFSMCIRSISTDSIPPKWSHPRCDWVNEWGRLRAGLNTESPVQERIWKRPALDTTRHDTTRHDCEELLQEGGGRVVGYDVTELASAILRDHSPRPRLAAGGSTPVERHRLLSPR